MSWEREESPRVGLSLWLGGEKRFILPPKAAFCCSHMINVVVSIVQVCTGSTWWKRTQSIPPIARISSLLSIPILLSPSSFRSFLLMCMGSVCCFDYVLNDRRLWYDKIDHTLAFGDRLNPFSSHWPCTDLHNWYYNIAHVRANRMPPLGVDKTILSPPKRSLSPTRGDSSLSQLFLFIFVDVCIVYVMFLAFGGRQNVFFITLTIHTV